MTKQRVLHENEWTNDERRAVQAHHRAADDPDISQDAMQTAWRDDYGTLCVKYVSGAWWHYGHGKWW